MHLAFVHRFKWASKGIVPDFCIEVLPKDIHFTSIRLFYIFIKFYDSFDLSHKSELISVKCVLVESQKASGIC